MGPDWACSPHRLPRLGERPDADGHAGQEAQGDNCAVGWGPNTLTYSHTGRNTKDATRRAQLEDRAPPVEDEGTLSDDETPTKRGVPDAATPRPCVHPLQEGTTTTTQTTPNNAEGPTTTTTTTETANAQIQLRELQVGGPRARSLKKNVDLVPTLLMVSAIIPVHMGGSVGPPVAYWYELLETLSTHPLVPELRVLIVHAARWVR